MSDETTTTLLLLAQRLQVEGVQLRIRPHFAGWVEARGLYVASPCQLLFFTYPTCRDALLDTLRRLELPLNALALGGWVCTIPAEKAPLAAQAVCHLLRHRRLHHLLRRHV